ncbi:uncharacterized protein LOC125942891 isoform X2 [Dermacentor silvarum]|uniref:uncharacterized protein LOC125942891 isoform X1 n=1 Tax=Dermacentor silvarum TaxID=543639 RepID=UPI0021007C3C|nr:uncharacterized protein LOC125942891 isoform X1 [Dermacentor silvarum]XP_049517102.1 uncharacterized protein LOC125942891 isoform X2 [Dermacentor silvarum]
MQLYIDQSNVICLQFMRKQVSLCRRRRGTSVGQQCRSTGSDSRVGQQGRAAGSNRLVELRWLCATVDVPEPSRARFPDGGVCAPEHTAAAHRVTSTAGEVALWPLTRTLVQPGSGPPAFLDQLPSGRTGRGSPGGRSPECSISQAQDRQPSWTSCPAEELDEVALVAAHPNAQSARLRTASPPGPVAQRKNWTR